MLLLGLESVPRRGTCSELVAVGIPFSAEAGRLSRLGVPRITGLAGNTGAMANPGLVFQRERLASVGCHGVAVAERFPVVFGDRIEVFLPTELTEFWLLTWCIVEFRVPGVTGVFELLLAALELGLPVFVLNTVAGAGFFDDLVDDISVFAVDTAKLLDLNFLFPLVFF